MSEKIEKITGLAISNTLQAMREQDSSVSSTPAHLFVHERVINRLVDEINLLREQVDILRRENKVRNDREEI